MSKIENRGKLSDRLKDKVAIVTGAGSGIGQGCALMFARHGARVVAVDIDAGAVETTRAQIRAEGLDLAPRQADLTKPSDVAALVDGVATEFGGIDILLNAAAVADFVWIEDMDYERHWRRTLTGELDTVFLMCKAAWPHLSARSGGAIINFGSANAYVALKNSPALAHTAGKGGVLAMTRQLAMEGSPHGIRANSISPGMIVTAATRPVLDRPELLAAVQEKLMVGRLGQPDDIAWAAVYLASDEAAYVTGADFRIDGGALAW
ncbi:SDR family oxidoreductase [Agrobacterium rhizogenes]|uniref:SDR family NAD(P)-dependent oxidoreductase n=1 Tax=Rhizobium rhizogenes TaxID=359 RepID=UPI001E00784B|nr:SDR family NAD(P)-dependent oxidoreductase [Rhizobium rhizogenes]NTF53007.1 SDR family oxidoreductase [Rhizobium rhizogenes]NTF65944.1 SDR family oxidoreductase [Rhizobium rhizogenes]NTG05166.1 SDR family oxidoreductase [Rhizobium rhizogenes]NTG18460.1 SDR family oxidoreductase [Rhizobium rhizogenes]NTG25264.1 SDR family oxidoreductase [Rhizobium rhizogenes]